MRIENFKLKINLSLCAIIFLAAFLRLYGINWDQGFSLHPDERAIMLFTTPLHFPQSLQEFLSPESLWNPHFFAYGSLPLYLLKTVSAIASTIDPAYGVYGKINLVGRTLSTFFDLGTLCMIYILGKKVFNQKIGLLGGFFYSISVLPIQLSHFYAVDTPLTFFILLAIFGLINFYENPQRKYAVLTGIFFGLSLATKVSASVLLAAIGAAIAADFLLIFLKNPHRIYVWFPHLPRILKKLIVDCALIIFITVITFIIFEPYALIDFKTFWLHNMQQRQMTYDPFTFPYTLQYVGKAPYLYELKNIFLFGLGPLLATLCFLGTIYVFFITLRKEKKQKWAQEFILLTFFVTYFLVVGKFAIGFMRYMLPLYPLLTIFAAVLFERLQRIIPSKLYAIRYTLYTYLLFTMIWPLSFIHIYTKPNTRVVASEWISRNIEPGKKIALEHWDDSLPLFGQENYRILTLPLYDPDTALKWESINQQLSQSDYIIIASNRLYVPLQKLTDCKKLPKEKCYPLTAEYYRKLFSGALGFRKVAGFSSFPQLSTYPALPAGRNFQLSIDDSSADESFTVYDHPKVMIFQRE